MSILSCILNQFIIQSMIGVVRSMHCDPDMAADIIPVDIAINAIITSAWERGIQEDTKDIEYRNITLSHDKQMTWGESVEKG